MCGTNFLVGTWPTKGFSVYAAALKKDETYAAKGISGVMETERNEGRWWRI